MTVEGDELAALRAAVDELRATVAAQTTRLERFDAFTESMFSRVERAVRAGIGEHAPAPPVAPAAATPPSFTDEDRARLQRLEEVVERFDRRMAEVASAEPEPTPLATTDREQLDALAARLHELVDIATATRDHITSTPDPVPSEPSGPARLHEADRSLLEQVVDRAQQLADTGADEPSWLERVTSRLDEVADRPTVDGLVGRLDQLADRPLLERVITRLDALTDRVDELAAQDPSTVVSADEVSLADADRDLLNLIVAKLAGLDDRLQHAPEAATTSDASRQDIESIRAQAIEDVANAIERAIGGDLSSKQQRRLQRSLSKAASNEASAASRPVRKPRPTAAGPQRQVVRLEREPVDPILDDRDEADG